MNIATWPGLLGSVVTLRLGLTLALLAALLFVAGPFPDAVLAQEESGFDLEVGTPTVDDASPDAGLMFNLTVEVTNTGTENSTRTRVKFYRSTDATITSADTEELWESSDVYGTYWAIWIRELSEGGKRTAKAGIKAPAATGTYYYGACVEERDGEADTTNNCSPALEVVVEKRFDLTIGAHSVSNDGPGVGEDFTLSSSVYLWNDADRTPSVSTTTLRYYRSTDAMITSSDTELGTGEITGLNARSFDWNWDLTTSLTAPTTAGTYYFGACVDSIPEESRTFNNCTVNPAAVVVGPRFDFTVSLDWPDTEVDQRQETNLVATVTNGGDAPSQQSWVRFYHLYNWPRGDDVTEYGSDYLYSIPAGGFVTKSHRTSGGGSPGTKYWKACVDEINGESDRSNNCSDVVAVVTGEGRVQRPDITVSVTADSTTVSTGGSFTLSATVTNAGVGDAEATTLRFYRSADATVSAPDVRVGTAEIAALASGGSSNQSVQLTPSTAGTYFYGACADRVADEFEWTPNCSEGVEVTVTAPDLTVTVTEPDEAILAGENFYLTATVTNEGGASAESRHLKFYRSSNDMTITTSDHVVSDFNFTGSITAGESAEVTALYHIIAPSSAGTYYYGACVAAARGESDTTNNCSAAVAVEVEVRPDLSIRSMTYGMDFESPRVGGTFPMGATIKNEGSKASGETTLRFYRSTDETITASDTEVATAEVTSLDAGERNLYSADITAPSTEGTYYYGACVDAVTDESDTTNNCYSSSYEIPVPLPRPDLEVGSPSVDDASLDTGATFTLSATVTNVGDWPSAPTTLRYYRSTDATITTSDMQVGTDEIDLLFEEESSTVPVSLTAPSTEGTYYYGACVDEVSGEPDNTNNCSTSVTVVVVNSPATGAPTITGRAQVGQTLTASTTGILDTNGLTSVSYSYQWLADDTEIDGATSSNYIVQSSDNGKVIKVRVSFTDDGGSDESLTSAGTAAVVLGGV